MLCCALQLSTSTEAIKSANSICCYNATNIKIPLARLESYFWISCPIKRIVAGVTRQATLTTIYPPSLSPTYLIPAVQPTDPRPVS
ncbi:hypothetical protein G5714_024042 [Onychostoma macrolepis]|uniref:Chemokine interleukin-8-like domain-containing protein n=1 Tax=Onychostoma macrolepis TaxID=369639 RepID=A0A7J6BJ98_9TELE|nr:hypothetical protein G5714_024042 [Onychostoma macrolepis]